MVKFYATLSVVWSNYKHQVPIILTADVVTLKSIDASTLF